MAVSLQASRRSCIFYAGPRSIRIARIPLRLPRICQRAHVDVTLVTCELRALGTWDGSRLKPSENLIP